MDPAHRLRDGGKVAEAHQHRGQSFADPIQERQHRPNGHQRTFQFRAAANRLEIEITETVFLESNANTMSMLHQLRQLGVRIIMDDFGTGYSSLSYLRSFPFDKLKIDRSFVEGLGKAEDSLAIVHAIVMLAKSLRIGVVAEGVETAEQFRILRLEGCQEFQGYFLSRPEPAGKIDLMLARCGERIRLAA